MREIVAMNLRSIPDRLGASLVIVVGIAGVVAVMVALLSMSTGLSATLGGTGREDQVVITRGGSNGELSSFLTVAAAPLGSLAGGALASAIGLRATLLTVGALGLILAVGAIGWSPVRAHRRLPALAGG